MSDSGEAEVDGARLAWWSDGEGPALVLVHAGVADARMWDPLLPALTPGHRVVRYDLRGFGRSRSQPGSFTAAGDLAGLLDALGIAQAHVVGASMSGMIALEFALQSREGIDEDELEPPVCARLATIGVPATIATGDRDVVDFETAARRLADELPDATLQHVADAGHLLALDQPAAVAQLILRHLERVY